MMGDQPLLGLATTRQLLEEIEARGQTERDYRYWGEVMARDSKKLLESLPESVLDYRTVKGDWGGDRA
jgi:hypothetical protein